MQVTIHSVSESEMRSLTDDYVEDGNVVPIRPVPEIEVARFVWEGNLDPVPLEGDSLMVPDESRQEGYMCYRVVDRIFDLMQEAGPTVTLIVEEA